MNNFKTYLAGGALLLASMTAMAKENPNFDYKVDRFADIEVLRYEVPGFNDLTPKQKEMLYYLSEAAQWGRDIIWDQNGAHNLQLRRILEKIYQNFDGDHNSKDRYPRGAGEIGSLARELRRETTVYSSDGGLTTLPSIIFRNTICARSRCSCASF